MQSLDTKAWNLWMAVAVVTGCGPGGIGGEGSNDGDGTDSDSGSDSGSGSDGAECQVNEDCPPGEYCYGGTCQYYYTCTRESGFAGCWYYECYSSDECTDGEICIQQYCEPVAEIPKCDTEFDLVNIPLPDDLQVLPTSLHFAGSTAPGVRDLLIGHSGGVMVVRSDNTSVDVPLDSAPVAIAIGDMDGDGEQDLVVSLTGDLAQVLLADEMSGFVPQTPINSEAAQLVVVGDFNHDGDGDAAACQRSGGCLLWLGDGAGNLATSPGPQIGSANLDATAPLDLSGEGTNDLAFLNESGGGAQYFWHSENGLGALEWLPDVVEGVPNSNLLTFGASGAQVRDIAVVSDWQANSLVSVWLDLGGGTYGTPFLGSLDGVTVAGTRASLQGDVVSSDELLVASESEIHAIAGLGAQSPCVQVWPAPLSIVHLAAGDFDGDDRDDVAVSDGETVRVLASVTP